MSVFGSIKDAIFGHDEPAAATSAPAAPATTPAPAAAPPPQAAAPAPKKMTTESINEVLARRAAARGEELHYKTSIVDLMKALGLDSSLENRKKLATELGYDGDQNDSASMNIWLHEKTMTRLTG